MGEKRSVWKAILIISIIIAVIATIYFTFFFYYGCYDKECFRAHQKKCVKTKYISETEDTIWSYVIKGKKEGGCEISVEVVRIKKGSLDRKDLEGKAMNCLLLLEDTSPPEKDISRCSGLLKEELQNKIIQKLHSYILENVGEIGEELDTVV